MSSTLHPMLNLAVRAARAAGVIINRAALDVEAVRVAQKQAHDFVTEVDQASEAAIIETLLTAYPDHGILAEESGRAHGNAHSEHIWIIDPLDGTTNFIHGFPVYCISIALQVAGHIEQAVVYDPTRNDLFTATRGRGAFLNDRRLRVSKRLYLSDCLIATGFPYRPGDDVPTYLEMMGTMMRATAGLRRPGSAALDLAYVAAGFSDGFFETGLKPWDVAAGSLLVTEAGGLIGNFTGEALQLDVPECLTANPRVYAQMVKLLARYSRAGQAPAPQPAADESGGEGESQPPAPESISAEAAAQPVPVVDAGPSETPTAADPVAPVETADPPPRPQLRAAPRRAPEPEDAPEPRYHRTAGPGPKPGPRDNAENFARPRKPAQAEYRERPYGKPAARPAGKFGPKNTGGRPAFGDRPPFQNRTDRPDRGRPAFNDRWSDRTDRYPADRYPADRYPADRYPAGPRRPDGPPRGRPAFGDRPAFQNRPDRSDRGRPAFDDRWSDRADRYPAGPRRADGPPRGKPAFGDRPAFNDRPGRPAPPRPMSGDRRDSRYPASPRRPDSGAPRGKPYTPRAPRSDR